METDTSLPLLIIANLTHQVINPINGIIGTLDNIVDGTISPLHVQQRVNSARAQLECVVSLIRNLAFFAEYSASDDDKIDKKKAANKCVIPQIIIEAAQFYQEAAKDTGIKIELVNRSDQNAVMGNSDLLRQVFMNIFDNGIKYGERDSTVELKDWIQAGTGDLIVEVKSHGIGFDPGEDIFGLGKRGLQAENLTSSGSGLGLYICKMIIERAFKGTITAQHVHRTNTTIFTIRIPGAFKMER